MAYSKTNWVDRSVQYPNRFTQAVNGSLVTLTPSPGTISQAGTALTAAYLNKMETQYDEAMKDVAASYAKRLIDYWHEVVYENLWFGPTGIVAQYIKDDLGMVHLRGCAQGGYTTPGTTLFTLPAGYRPPQSVTQVTMTTDSNGVAQALSGVTILPDGRVQYYGGASPNRIYVDGVSFHVI